MTTTSPEDIIIDESRSRKIGDTDEESTKEETCNQDENNNSTDNEELLPDREIRWRNMTRDEFQAECKKNGICLHHRIKNKETILQKMIEWSKTQDDLSGGD